MEIDNITTLQFLNTRIWQLTRQQISNERLQLFHLLNGDIFYAIQDPVYKFLQGISHWSCGTAIFIYW